MIDPDTRARLERASRQLAERHLTGPQATFASDLSSLLAELDRLERVEEAYTHLKGRVAEITGKLAPDTPESPSE